MAYTRADNVQVDTWESIGNNGWNWEALLPYYMKSQLLNTPTAAQAEAGITFDPEVNGFDGPLKTGWASNVQTGDMHTVVNDTYASLGVPWNKDVNDGEMRGYNRYVRFCPYSYDYSRAELFGSVSRARLLG